MKEFLKRLLTPRVWTDVEKYNISEGAKVVRVIQVQRDQFGNLRSVVIAQP